jgi:hypothetical protein
MAALTLRVIALGPRPWPDIHAEFLEEGQRREYPDPKLWADGCTSMVICFRTDADNAARLNAYTCMMRGMFGEASDSADDRRA